MKRCVKPSGIIEDIYLDFREEWRTLERRLQTFQTQGKNKIMKSYTFLDWVKACEDYYELHDERRVCFARKKLKGYARE